MRVIEKGDGWRREIGCTGCGAGLEIEVADLRFGDFGVSYIDERQWKFYVECAACAEKVVVRNVPAWIAELVWREKRDHGADCA